jgi:hypothetical protein
LSCPSASVFIHPFLSFFISFCDLRRTTEEALSRTDDTISTPSVVPSLRPPSLCHFKRRLPRSLCSWRRLDGGVVTLVMPGLMAPSSSATRASKTTGLPTPCMSSPPGMLRPTRSTWSSVQPVQQVHRRRCRHLGRHRGAAARHRPKYLQRRGHGAHHPLDGCVCVPGGPERGSGSGGSAGTAKAEGCVTGEEQVSRDDRAGKSPPTCLRPAARSRFPSAVRGNGNDERMTRAAVGTR